MCDTLCVIESGGAIFAKNSDRPPFEVQLIESHGRRTPNGRLHTQYLEIDDAPSAAILIGRPDWLRGAEHGVNEHAVAIGNEKVDTNLDPARFPPALIGMDLVRLGLERGATAEEALEVMTALIDEHGQGGTCELSSGQSYFSSFLIVDPRSGWKLETSGNSWVAEPVNGAAAISNRLSIGLGWTRSSTDVDRGTDFYASNDTGVDSSYAGVRLAAANAFVTGADLTASAAVAHLRDHGTGPWGAPDRVGEPVPPPLEVQPDGTGVTVCMHVRGVVTTTSSIVSYLPSDPSQPMRSWVACGSPCVSVYVPVFGVETVPDQLSDRAFWELGARLRQLVETDGEALVGLRSLLDPVERELWEEADSIAHRPELWHSFEEAAGLRCTEALAKACKDTGA